MSEQLDSLRSTQIVRYIDAVCEGEIKGLVNGLRSIYINDTPLENSDGSKNFQGLSLQGRPGTADQTPMDGFGEVETSVAVGVEAKYNLPIVRTITNPLADSVRVTIGTNSLVQFKDNGDIVGSEVHYEIAIQNNGRGFESIVVDALKGKTTSAYRRSYRIKLPPGGPWDIRVRKLSQDSISSKHSNGLIFDSYAAIVESKLAYPHTAVVGISIDAQHFSQVPTRAYHVYGKIIRVPSNYDPVARTYDGIWDGTFKEAYSNNPAWCFYDLLTAERYGLGRYLDEAVIDRWELYAIGKYCDQMVPDGKGGHEPRFTCNLVLQTREEAFRVLQNMASIFRGVAYWGAAGVVPVQDRLQEPVALFTNANVINGEFSYSGTSLRARHTVALVSWNDPQDMYRQKIEYVQDDEAVAKWGVIPSEVSGFGCNSRGQAARAGRWLLATEKAEDETVTFKTGFEGGGIYPGAVISTSDINRTLARFCGRICLSTAANIELDAPITMKTGVAYQLMVTMPDGKPQRRAIVSAAGETKQVTVSPPFDEAPLVDASFAVIEGQAEPEQWRVIGLEENEDASITVTALKYNKSKYDAVERGLKLDELPPTNLRATPQPPTDLQFVVSNGDDGLTGLLSWAGDAPRYIVRWRYADDSWTEQQVEEQSLDFRGLRVGKYTFTVAAVNALGLSSRQTRLEFEVTPQAIKLPSVTGLALEGRFTGDTAKFKWDAVPGATGYTVRVIVGGEIKREVAVGDALRFDYSAADMRADGGPWRGFEFAVKATGQWGSESDWASITVGNRQAGAPIAISVRASIRVGYVSLTAPPEDDIVGMVVWCSDDPACPAIDANKVYDGAVGMVAVSALADGSALAPGKTYHVRAAVYDSFGRDNLNASTSVPFTPLLVDIGPNTITETEIKDNSISTPKLRANAVRAHNIAANEIHGTHIAARQLTGEHIQAGTLTADLFRSSLGSGNLLPNAGLIPSWSNTNGQQADGWNVTGESAFSGAVISPDASKKPPHTEYMAFVFLPNSRASAITAYSERFPAAEDTWYEVHAMGAGSGGWVDVQLIFFSASGTVLPPKATKGTALVSNGVGRATRNLKDWQQVFYLVQAPAGTASARLDLKASPGYNTSQVEMFICRPYVGAAISPQQATPTPWSPPGLGTQIHGGMIKTNTIHANAIAVDRLSAFSSNLGEVTAGDIYGLTVRGGNFGKSNAWPGSGGGFHLSNTGLRMGSRNTGRWVEIDSNGNFSAPGMSITNGKLAIDELRVIKASNIARDAISRHFRVSSATFGGSRPTLVVTASEECSAVIHYGMHPKIAQNGMFTGPNEVTLYSNSSILHSSRAVYANWDNGGSNTGSRPRHSVWASGALSGPVPRGVYTLSLSEPGFIEVLLVFR